MGNACVVCCTALAATGLAAICSSTLARKSWTDGGMAAAAGCGADDICGSTCGTNWVGRGEAIGIVDDGAIRIVDDGGDKNSRG